MRFKGELTRIGEGSVDLEGKPQKIVIDRVTHLGRSSKKKCCTSRVSMSTIRDAKVIVKIQPVNDDSQVSRNHAMIYPPLTEDDETFGVRDLNSSNGTTVNGKEIPAHRRIPLKKGDVICLGNEISFVFDLIPDEQNINYGLMIGHWGGNLKGTSQDVEVLKKELEKRGFKGNLITLVDNDATKDKILTKLDILKGYVTSDSVFVLYFTGHGTPEGYLEIDDHLKPVKHETLNAKELSHALRGFRGKILVILDGCHTWKMAEQLDFFEGAIICNEGKAYEGHVDSPDSDIRPIQGYTTHAIVEILRKEEHRINVKELVEKIREDVKIKTVQFVRLEDTAEIMIGSRTRDDALEFVRLEDTAQIMIKDLK